MAVERITIITEMIDKATGKLRKVSETTKELSRTQAKSVEITRKLDEKTNRMNITTRKTTTGLKTFNFAWLSVMFAGMALNRVFGGLIRSQLELFGITELFAATLTLVMLPIMETLLPLFLKLSEIFINLPEGVKLSIGVFIILGFIFGTILLILGQLALAIGGFMLLWPRLGTVASAVTGALAGSLGIILAIIAVIVIVAIGMFLAWKNNFLGMKQVVDNFISGIKQQFNGLIQIVNGILSIIKGIFLGDFELIKEGIMSILTGLWNFTIGGFKAVGNFILGVFIGIIQIIFNLIKIIADAWNKFFDIFERFGGLPGRNLFAPPKLPGFQHGGIVPGRLGTPVPIIAHAGERIIPTNRAGSGGGVTINQTITVSGSNAKEFEDIIKRNNLKLTEDIRRLSQR